MNGPVVRSHFSILVFFPPGGRFNRRRKTKETFFSKKYRSVTSGATLRFWFRRRYSLPIRDKFHLYVSKNVVSGQETSSYPVPRDGKNKVLNIYSGHGWSSQFFLEHESRFRQVFFFVIIIFFFRAQKNSENSAKPNLRALAGKTSCRRKAFHLRSTQADVRFSRGFSVPFFSVIAHHFCLIRFSFRKKKNGWRNIAINI